MAKGKGMHKITQRHSINKAKSIGAYHKRASFSKCAMFLLISLFLAPVVPIAAAQSNSICNLTSGTCPIGSGQGIVTTMHANATGKPIYMALAYAPGCPHCEALDNFIINLSSKYNIQMTYINALTNQATLSRFLSYYKVPQSDYGVVPILFVNGTYCIGDTQCISLLSENIASFAKDGTPPLEPNSGSLGTMSFFEITALALVDSVNPCAFAVLIFLLSTLFMRDPNNRRTILLGGIAFAMGVFIFYFIIGLLLLMGIKAALAVAGLSNAYVYIIFGIFAVLLGIFNLKDYFSYGSLGFVMEVPMRWKPKMLATIEKNVLGRIATITGSFIAGVLVTAFLLPCITGPYFLSGSILKALPLPTASLWLVYYNILFILPMLVITLLVYFSFTSIEKASEFREKNIRKLHLVAGLLLILVGAIMFYSVLA